MQTSLLCIDDLNVSFLDGEQRSTVIDGVNLTVGEKEIIGLVGESGCGKSVTSRAIMGMIKRPGRIDRGSICFEEKELIGLSKREYQKLRGKDIAMIFQEPMTALNPVYTVGMQMVETIRTHLNFQKKEAVEYAAELLDKVGVSMPKERLTQYPHELSGGMRQRVMIAIALSCHPRLLIADEPTTALDVTIQAQILELMQHLCSEEDMSTIVVTHDMGVVAELCQRVVVMYSGRVVESAPVKELFYQPLHPYTKALLQAIPKIGEHPEKLYTIPGTVLPPGERGNSCHFHSRCSMCTEKCRQEKPPEYQIGDRRSVSCWLYENNGDSGAERTMGRQNNGRAVD